MVNAGMEAIARKLFADLTLSWLVGRLVVFGPAIWLLFCRLNEATVEMVVLPDRDVMHTLRIDAFQLMAWGVAFILLRQLGPTRRPNHVEIAAAITICLIGELSSAAGLAALTIYLVATTVQDRAPRLAVATVFGALFVQQTIIPILYDVLVPIITRFDTMLVGSFVELTVRGSTWQGDTISVPWDHSIIVAAGCSSFRNVSLATLCWVSLTKLERPEWRRLDIGVLAIAAGFQIALNVTRIYLMALSDNMYLYWHTGMGSHIFAVTASAGAVLVCAFGARYVSIRTSAKIINSGGIEENNQGAEARA